MRPSRHEKGSRLYSDSDTCWAEGDSNLSSFSEVRRGGLSIFAATNTYTDTLSFRPPGQQPTLKTCCLFLDGGV